MPTLSALLTSIGGMFSSMGLIVIVAAGVIVGLVAYFAGAIAKRTR